MELLEAGPEEPRRDAPRWLLPLVVALLALAALAWWATHRGAADRTDGSGPTQGAAPSPLPGASRPIESGQSFSAAPAPAPWPSEAGACGNVAWLPVLEAGVGARPEVSLLVGGAALTLVDVHAGVGRQLWTPEGDGAVTDLQSAPGHGTYLVTADCQPDAGALWRLGSITTAVEPVAAALGMPWLIPGPHGPWQAQTPAGLDDVSGGAYRLRSVVSGETARLPADVQPIAVTDAGVVAASGSTTDDGQHTQLWSSGGRLVRDLGHGWPLGVTPHGDVLATGNSCNYGDAGSCRLRLIDPATGRTRHEYQLPAGEYVTSGVAFDARSRLAAFTLSLTGTDAPYGTGHPFPPSRPATLDLVTGAVTSVPGLELAPKTNAGIAISRSEWLFITVSLGDHGQVIAWRSGLPAPVHVVDIAGPLSQAPPVQVLPLP